MAAILKMEHDEDTIAGYDVSTELPPNCPTYHPSYKIVTEKFAEILELLRGPLDESSYTDPNVEALKSLLRDRSKARFPDEVRIALVGDMASGKSSLINSLLSVGVLARKVCCPASYFFTVC
jgi:polynucleotide 5'-kinase involved in rRNA processing